MDVCPPPFVFNFSPEPAFFDAFNYTASHLVGSGPWLTFPTRSDPALLAPGSVVLYPGNPGAQANVAAVNRNILGKWRIDVEVFWPTAATGSGGNMHVFLNAGILTFTMTVNIVDAAIGEIEQFNGGGAAGDSLIPKNVVTKLRWDAPGDGFVHCYNASGLVNDLDLTGVTDFVPTLLKLDGSMSSTKAFQIRSIFYGKPAGPL